MPKPLKPFKLQENYFTQKAKKGSGRSRRNRKTRRGGGPKNNNTNNTLNENNLNNVWEVNTTKARISFNKPGTKGFTLQNIPGTRKRRNA